MAIRDKIDSAPKANHRLNIYPFDHLRVFAQVLRERLQSLRLADNSRGGAKAQSLSESPTSAWSYNSLRARLRHWPISLSSHILGTLSEIVHTKPHQIPEVHVVSFFGDSLRTPRPAWAARSAFLPLFPTMFSAPPLHGVGSTN